MRPITVTVGNQVTAASATALRTASIVNGPGDLVLDGAQVVNGIGVLEADRNILLTVVAGTGGRVMIEGVNTAGYPVSESMFVPLGFSGTIQSTMLYRKVFRASASLAIISLSIGTVATGTSPWVAFDSWAPSPISIQTSVAGTANYTVQSTLDNPTDTTSPIYNVPQSAVWINSSDATMVGASTGLQSNFLFAPQFARILLNSGTGLVTATFLQSGAS